MMRRDTSRSYQEVMKLVSEMRLDPVGLLHLLVLAITVTQEVHNNCSHVITADRFITDRYEARNTTYMCIRVCVLFKCHLLHCS